MRHHRLPRCGDFRHHRHPDRQHCARTVATVARDYPSSQRFDKAAANCQPEPGTGTPAVLRLNTIELIENALEVAGWYAGSLIDDFDLDEFAVAARAEIDPGAGG